MTNDQRKKIVKVEQLETFAEIIDTLYGSPMGASGQNHAPGQVPDPGATAGTSKYLREDGTWVVPPNDNTTYQFSQSGNTLQMGTNGGSKSDIYTPSIPVSSVAGKTGAVTLDKSDVGLGNVTNDAQVKRSEMGVASGVATLDSTGKVPSSQLPSYVDDAIEGYYYNSKFYKESSHMTEITGESGKIYTDLVTNTTYRWSGTTYTQIKGDLVIGTASGNAADGKIANDHYNNTSNPHSVTKAQVGLGSVVNTGDSATPVSGGTTKFTTGGAYTELAKKVDKVEGKGLSTNDYTTTEKNKLSGIAAGAEVNQNAFSNVGVKVGNTTTTVAADAKTDTVTLIQGSNVTLTADTTNDTITIDAKDTTYSEATTSAAGLMSSSDKSKLNGIESGAQTHRAPTTAEVKSALGTGSGTSKYLREDGTWQDPLIEDPFTGYEYVDMGLPSGILWAKCNIGANTPEGYGLYFSWGNLEGHAKGSGYDFSQAVYNNTPGAEISDNLSLSQDAARANFGKAWRMPTKEEFAELCNSEYTDFIDGSGNVITGTDKRTTYNSVVGLRIRSKANGNILFFPAAGAYNDTTLGSEGSYGVYWSSSFNSATNAYILYFYSGGVFPHNNNNRRYGFSVRAVHVSASPLPKVVLLKTEVGAANGVASLDNSGKVSSSQLPLGETSSTAYRGDKGKLVYDELFDEVEYVDMGLPSGLLWAKCNVGASAPEQAGLYFSWGNVDGYVDGDGFEGTQAEYEASHGYTLGATDNIPATAEYDAAVANIGDGWRMPTTAEIQELFNSDYTTNEWVTNYQGSSMNGRLVTSKANGNTLFFPAAGCFYGGLYYFGLYSYYWSSSYDDEDGGCAMSLESMSDYVNPGYNLDRWTGSSVRPVHASSPAPQRKSKKANIDEVTKPCIEITWANLKSLRDNSQLVPGQFYRITDYTCTTTQANTQSAGHVFDVIVRADDVNVLNEDAYAAKHAGDTYFANSNLAAWELKYTIDNDTTKFAWADSTNGKGVIYYMKDESNNECPYDFKNIQFKRYQLKNQNSLHLADYPMGDSEYSAATQTAFNVWKAKLGNAMDATNAAFYYTKGIHPDGYVLNGAEIYNSSSDYESYDNGNLTFDDESEGNYVAVACIYDDFDVIAEVVNTTGEWFYTFSKKSTTAATATDASMDTNCYENIIKGYFKGGAQNLNDTIFIVIGNSITERGNSFDIDCYNNTFGDKCYNNSFENECSYNSFGNNCGNNSFRNRCSYNSFGNNCNTNSFGNSCYYNFFGHSSGNNSFGNECTNNSFGGEYDNNSFGNACCSNSFGNYCERNFLGTFCNSNSFGNGCRDNSFGNSCSYNSFENYCEYNSFGNAYHDNSLGNYCNSNSFGNECFGISFVDYCSNNSFGNKCTNNTLSKDYSQNNIFENGNQYITLTSTQTTSASATLQNIKICQGVNNTSTPKTISHNTVNDTFQTEYKPANSQVISV